MQGRLLPRERPLALVLPSAVPTPRHAHCSRRASSVGPSGRSGHPVSPDTVGRELRHHPRRPPPRISFPARSKAVWHLPAALRCSACLQADSNGCPKLRTSSVSGDFGMLKQNGGSGHEPERSANRPSAACEGEAKLSEPAHVVDGRDRNCVWCGRCPVAAVPLATRADKCRPAADTGVVRLSNADWTFGSQALPRTRAGWPIRSHVRCAQTGIRRVRHGGYPQGSGRCAPLQRRCGSSRGSQRMTSGRNGARCSAARRSDGVRRMLRF